VKKFPASISEGHADYAELSRLRDSIIQSAGGESAIADALPQLLQDAIDFVIDPVRTARNSIVDLDNVEKTFIGLKVEHFLRDFLNVPSGLRDLVIDGTDVDIKNTVSTTWTIPPETYRSNEPCLLIAIADAEKKFWLGLIIAKSEYLTKAGNRDSKKSVSAEGLRHILWLVEGAALPASRFHNVDLKRFRELREMKGGSKRAAQFFRENLNRPFHRVVVQTLLHDQLDYMKRLRGNGGARDLLKKDDVVLLSSAYEKASLEKLGFEPKGKDFWVAFAKST
jgi:Restriction endonuclease NaeI